MCAYNFSVSGPKFTNFFPLNVGRIVVDHLLFRFLISPSVREIFSSAAELAAVRKAEKYAVLCRTQLFQHIAVYP